MESWQNLIHVFVMVFLSHFAAFMINPVITDVTMEAVCPGKDECSLAIYLTGFQLVIGGLGSVVLMPLLGNFSDSYGRKLLLTIPLTLSIIPFVILAINQTTEFFYVYYGLKTLTSMVTQGGVICLSLSYLADNVSDGSRVSAFGLLSGVQSAATLGGTLAARLLSTTQIFQLATIASILALVYMSVFVKDTGRRVDALKQPILTPTIETNEVCNEPHVVKKISLPNNIIRLLKSSTTISLASIIAFFNSLAEAAVLAFLMYYLKARFQFQKDQFADISLITFAGETISNMVLVPILGPLLGEETLLCIGLFAGFLNMLFDSIAWAPWVPYASAFFGILLSLTTPSIRCIISKQAGPDEQGIAQGCLMGIVSFANVVSPLIYSPLSAVFLSDSPPFNFPGFSILCIGLAWFAGFMLSIIIKILPYLSRNKEHCALA